jgi:isopenicillin-N N-acyltransferase like protein
MTPLKMLDVGDDPFERGLLHGRTLAQEISENAETYLAMFLSNGLSREEALAEGGRWVPVIRECDASYAEEMRGIATGADVPEALVGMLNARYEIAFSLFGAEARKSDAALEPEGCTSFGLMPESTADGSTILGQNWDWLAGVQGGTVVLRITRSSGPNIISLNEAGIVGGKQGVNSAGIGLVENGLVSNHDGINSYTAPFHLRCRQILEAETYDHALLPVLKTKRTCSANYVVGHADGEIIDMETSPNKVTYQYPKDGIVTHSNHFTDDGHGESQMERIGPSTLFRSVRLRRLLEKNNGSLNSENIAECLKDHFGYPHALCRHPDERQPEARRTMTNSAVIIDLNRHTLAVTDGPPCESAFMEFSFDKEVTAAAE